MLKTKRIKSGSWQTVEWFWNAGGKAFFKAPGGASIKVRYGVGFERAKRGYPPLAS